MLVRQVVVESVMVSFARRGSGSDLRALDRGDLLPAQFAPEEAEMLDTSLDLFVIGDDRLLCVVRRRRVVRDRLRRGTRRRRSIRTSFAADAGGITTRGGYTAEFRTVVVTSQVALSTVLLIGAGLLVQALSVALEGRAWRPDSRGVSGIASGRIPGIKGKGILLRGIRFHNGVTQMARQVPDWVAAAGWIATLPVGRGRLSTHRDRCGAGRGSPRTLEVDVNVASSRLLSCAQGDSSRSRGACSTTGMARSPQAPWRRQRYSSPAGFSARWPSAGRYLRDPEGARRFEIVGVVRSGKYRTLQETPAPMVYYSLSQRTPEFMHMVVRAEEGRWNWSNLADPRRHDRPGQMTASTSGQFHVRPALEGSADARSAADHGRRRLRAGRAGAGHDRRLRCHRRSRAPPDARVGLRVALGASRSGDPPAGLRRRAAADRWTGSRAGRRALLLFTRVVRIFVHGLPADGASPICRPPSRLR